MTKSYLHELAETLHKHYQRNEKKLVYLCYSKGITQQEIGDALGVSKQRITQKYPKENYEQK